MNLFCVWIPYNNSPSIQISPMRAWSIKLIKYVISSDMMNSSIPIQGGQSDLRVGVSLVEVDLHQPQHDRQHQAGDEDVEHPGHVA